MCTGAGEAAVGAGERAYRVVWCGAVDEFVVTSGVKGAESD